MLLTGQAGTSPMSANHIAGRSKRGERRRRGGRGFEAERHGPRTGERDEEMEETLNKLAVSPN